MRPTLGTLAVVALAVLAGCGGSSGTGRTAASGSSTTVATTTTTLVSLTTTTAGETTTSATTEAPVAAPAPTEPPATEPPATEPSTSPAPPATGNAALTIVGFAFSPKTMTVARGTTVTVTNNDSTAHTWTADNMAFDSGSLRPSGGAYSFTFTTPGTYAYHCNFHPTTMTGTVNVT